MTQNRAIFPACRSSNRVNWSRIRRGGMGTVWAVRDRSSGLLRALKLLRRPEADARLRFLREVEVMRELTHASLVELHDVVDLRSGPALVMDSLEGETSSASPAPSSCSTSAWPSCSSSREERLGDLRAVERVLARLAA